MNDNPYSISGFQKEAGVNPTGLPDNQQEAEAAKFAEQTEIEKLKEADEEKFKQQKTERSDMAQDLTELSRDFKPGGKFGSLSEEEKQTKIKHMIDTQDKFKKFRMGHSSSQKEKIADELLDPNKRDFAIKRVEQGKQI